jgi:hypothetical protein
MKLNQAAPWTLALAVSAGCAQTRCIEKNLQRSVHADNQHLECHGRPRGRLVTGGCLGYEEYQVPNCQWVANDGERTGVYIYLREGSGCHAHDGTGLCYE